MKALNFIAGVALGAAATIVAVKKFKVCSAGEASEGESALKEAESTAENLRSSVDSLRKELNARIESEQTYASKCEELKSEVAKQTAEIENLKNVCDKQAGLTKKLEQQLSEAKGK